MGLIVSTNHGQLRCVQLLAKEHLYKLIAPSGKANKRAHEATDPGNGEQEPKEPKEAKAKGKAKASPKKRTKKDTPKE